MESAIQKIAILSFTIVGISHVVQSKLWARFFIFLAKKNEVGAVINGFVHFPLGALIVVFHNVWNGIPLILTVIGYGLVGKTVINLVFPRLGLKSIRRVTLDRHWEFIVGGVLYLLISAALIFSQVTE